MTAIRGKPFRSVNPSRHELEIYISGRNFVEIGGKCFIMSGVGEELATIENTRSVLNDNRGPHRSITWPCKESER